MSLIDRLASHFQAHPGEWIDGRQLMTIAGSYAWRTRCSELRTLRGMTIQNRVDWMKDNQGRRWKESFYRYVPAEAA